MIWQYIKNISLLLLFLSIFISCSDPGQSLQVKIDKDLQLTNSLNSFVQFKVANLDQNNKKATIQVDCDFNRVDSDTYLSQLGKVEQILNKQGIKGISYQIINKPVLSPTKSIDENNIVTHSDIDSLGKFPKNLIHKDKYNTIQKNPEQKDNNQIKSNPLNNRAEINYDYVKLRNKPTVKSKLITYLFRGTVVKIIRKTKVQFQINNVSNYWYYITTQDRKQGWIFGEYLNFTTQKTISSSFQHNLIYRDFIKNKKNLVKKQYQKYLSNPIKNINIQQDIIHVGVNDNNELQIPFQIADNSIKWNKKSIRVQKRQNSHVYNNHNDFLNGEPIQSLEQRKLAYQPQNRYKKYDDRSKFIDNSSAKNDTIDSAKYYKKDLYTRKSVIPVKDYNLTVNLSPYIKKVLPKHDLYIAEAIIKVFEARLFSHDYEDKVKFHYNFSIFYDTINISLLDIDLVKKLATFEVSRITPDPSGDGPKELVRDRWVIDFTTLNNTSMNFDKLGDIYYSDVLYYLTRSGTIRKELIIGMTNYLIDLLLKQKYL